MKSGFIKGCSAVCFECLFYYLIYWNLSVWSWWYDSAACAFESLYSRVVLFLTEWLNFVIVFFLNLAPGRFHHCSLRSVNIRRVHWCWSVVKNKHAGMHNCCVCVWFLYLWQGWTIQQWHTWWFYSIYLYNSFWITNLTELWNGSVFL